MLSRTHCSCRTVCDVTFSILSKANSANIDDLDTVEYVIVVDEQRLRSEATSLIVYLVSYDMIRKMEEESVRPKWEFIRELTNIAVYRIGDMISSECELSEWDPRAHWMKDDCNLHQCQKYDVSVSSRIHRLIIQKCSDPRSN